MSAPPSLRPVPGRGREGGALRDANEQIEKNDTLLHGQPMGSWVFTTRGSFDAAQGP